MFSKREKKICPLIRKPCIEHGCEYYINIRGVNPNTGDPMDKWDCVNKWMPFLMIENSQQQRATGAAVESFRNEMVRANQSSQEILVATLQSAPNAKLIGE